MHGCRMNNRPGAGILPHPDSVPHLQLETDKVGPGVIHVLLGVMESSAFCKCPDLAVSIQHNVGRYTFVTPGHNSGEEYVGTTYWCSEDAIDRIVPPSKISDDITINDIDARFIS